MTDHTISTPTSHTAELAEIVERVIAQIKAGEPVEIDSLLRDHPEHADELRGLLPAVQMMADFSNSSDAGAAHEVSGDPLGDLGDFRLIREVGRGGMGVVYEAEQISLGRRVALKVLPFAATMDSKQLQRFRNEAKAAASLEHPNIVPIYGVGCERGVHFYAMKFIDGATLAGVIDDIPLMNDDCRAKMPVVSSGPSIENQQSKIGNETVAALTTKKDKQHFRAIAALIADAADALEYAHSMGIVHRDVKPGNLMLDAAGKLWVTDFGLARFGPDAGLTMSGDLLGTLRYMAPEQALAKHSLVDYRVDVYGLGATLYELLTGKPAVRGEDKQEILKAIAFEEPTALRKIDKSIPAELETITLKALAKEPEERYATAGELAADLRRWLEDKAILAKPPGLKDRVAKWAERHRAGIAGTVAFLILATTGLTASVVLLAKKESETGKANASAQKRLEQLEKANNLLGSVFEKLDPRDEGKGGPTLSEQLKAQFRRAIQELDGEAVGDELTVAKIQNTLGRSLTGLGEPAEAVTLLEKAVATRQRLLGPEHDDSLASVSNLAAAFLDAGRYVDAIRLFEFVRDARVAKLGADHLDTLTTLNDLAMAYSVCGKLPEAIRLYEQVRDARIAKLGVDDPATLNTLNNLAVAYHKSGKLPEAIRLHEQVRDASAAKLGPDHSATLTTLNNLAEAYRAAGRLPEAIRLHEQMRDAFVGKYGTDHPATLSELSNLAGAYQASGRLPEAIHLFERVRDAFVAKSGADHPSTLTALSNLAVVYEAAGRLPDAIVILEKVRDAQIAKLGADHPGTLTTLNNLASAYRAAGKLPEAIRIHEQVRDVSLAKFGPDHPHTLGTLNNLAFAYARSDRLPEAIRLLEQVRDARVAKLGSDHPDTLVTATNLAVCYENAGRLPEAIRLGEQVRDAKVAKLGRVHPDTLTTLNNLAGTYGRSGRLTEAVQLFEEAASGIERQRFQHQYAAMILNGTIHCYEQLKEFEKAAAWRRKWLMVVKEKSGAESPEYAAGLSGLGLTLILAEKHSDAENVLRESLAIRVKKQPDSWLTFNSRSMLGGALLGQKKYAEAEPLLLDGFEGMQQRAATIPTAAKPRLAEALERIIRLYDETNQKDKADKWREKLAAAQTATPQSQPPK